MPEPAILEIMGHKVDLDKIQNPLLRRIARERRFKGVSYSDHREYTERHKDYSDHREHYNEHREYFDSGYRVYSNYFDKYSNSGRNV